MMEVRFPEGITHMLVIDTDQYSGNFERQLAAYVTGAYDEHRGHGWHEREEFLQDAKREGWEDIADTLEQALTVVRHEEYDFVSNTIRPTPGRINNGYGVHRDAGPGEKGFPAFESVAIFFNRRLMKTEMEIVRRRAQMFADRKNLTIRDVYMMQVKVEKTETRLDI